MKNGLLMYNRPCMSVVDLYYTQVFSIEDKSSLLGVKTYYALKIWVSSVADKWY